MSKSSGMMCIVAEALRLSDIKDITDKTAYFHEKQKGAQSGHGL
jgi:hypothetical protein